MTDDPETTVILRDPVCGMDVPGDGPRVVLDGVQYGFCEDVCLQLFMADPRRWSPGFQHDHGGCHPAAVSLPTS
jgi:YHS domain-containing protein